VGEDIEAIAAKLTDAQRRAATGKTRWLTHARSLEWPMCGTVERMPGFPHSWQATPLGLAVRSHLLNQERKD